MNHAVAGVNAGYITRSKLLSDHLRQQQETISRKMTDVVRSRVKGHQERAMAWPFVPARTVLKNVLRLVQDGGVTSPSTTVRATRQRVNRTASEVAAGRKLDVAEKATPGVPNAGRCLGFGSVDWDAGQAACRFPCVYRKPHPY
jgi:hypothetical protein